MDPALEKENIPKEVLTLHNVHQHGKIPRVRRRARVPPRVRRRHIEHVQFGRRQHPWPAVVLPPPPPPAGQGTLGPFAASRLQRRCVLLVRRDDGLGVDDGHADVLPVGIVDDLAVSVPVDVGGWAAAAFDVTGQREVRAFLDMALRAAGDGGARV